MDRFISLGTTTIEAKTGYGLNTDSELKSLEVIKNLDLNHSIDLVPTFMGAHAFPVEYQKNQQGFVNLIIDEMIPQLFMSKVSLNI